jgi:prenyltransferase beta subunit
VPEGPRWDDNSRRPKRPSGHAAEKEQGKPDMRRYRLHAIILTLMAFISTPAFAAEIYPKHINAKAQQSIKKALDYLAAGQSEDGNWNNSADGIAYPTVMASLSAMAFLSHGDTPTRGPYADNIRRAELFIIGNARPSGLITSPAEDGSRSMYGHGFSMLFLSEVYGMETDPRTHDTLKKVIQNAIKLTASAQSPAGGWIYTPGGGGDEGSVTVTQMQGLRAAQNAGFSVPKGTVEQAIKYLEKCKTPEGGIEYSLASGGGPRLAISAAAIATLYNAGQYDSKLADDCLNYVVKQFEPLKNQFSKGTGHEFYTHLYASQAFYQAGDKYWDDYFPKTRDQLIQMQQANGSWDGDGVGPVYGAAIGAIIMQLPYKFLPIYQR